VNPNIIFIRILFLSSNDDTRTIQFRCTTSLGGCSRGCSAPLARERHCRSRFSSARSRGGVGARAVVRSVRRARCCPCRYLSRAFRASASGPVTRARRHVDSNSFRSSVASTMNKEAKRTKTKRMSRYCTGCRHRGCCQFGKRIFM
jgi:hypothetical protein